MHLIMQVLQINLNRHWATQNLLVQYVAEQNFDLACVSDPAPVPRRFSNANGLAAIYIGTRHPRWRCTLSKVGRNYVVVRVPSHDAYYCTRVFVYRSFDQSLMFRRFTYV